MFGAFRAAVADLPTDYRFMLNEGWLHRYSKLGPTGALLLPAAGGKPVVVQLDQGDEEAVEESEVMEESAFASLVGATPFGQLLRGGGRRGMLVTRDLMLPFDEQLAHQQLGFQPHAIVHFLGDRATL